MDRWYCLRAGRTDGPFTLDALRVMFHTGQLMTVDLVWRERFISWQQIAYLPELFSASVASPSLPPARPPEQPERRYGNLIATGYFFAGLALFLSLPFGLFGMHVGMALIRRNQPEHGRRIAMISGIMTAINVVVLIALMVVKNPPQIR